MLNLIRHPNPGSAVVAICCFLTLAACAPASAPSRSESSSAGQGVSGPKTLRLGLHASREPTDGIIQFGGGGSGAAEHYLTFHAGLTVYDSAGVPQRRLAQKIPTVDDGDWRVFPDGRMEVTWTLRPEARWHDGAPLTADDFLLSLQVMQDPAMPIRRPASSASITEAQAPDLHTLIVSWKQPYMLGNFAGPDDMPALPRHILGDLYARGDVQAFTNSLWWTREFVGLGPYKIGSWELGSQIEALAFDQYVLGRPKIDRVIIRYVGDVNALVANLLAGDLDMSPTGASLDAPQLLTVKNAWEPNGLGTTTAVPRGVRNLHLQRRDANALWARDVRVRQALVHMIDRPSMVEVINSGIGGPADTYVTRDDPVYRLLTERGLPTYPYDLGRADRLLTEAGLTRGADGFYQAGPGQRFVMEVAATGRGENPQEAEAVAALWAAGGVGTRVVIIPPNATDLDERKNTVNGALVWPFNPAPDRSAELTTAEVPSERTRWKGSNYGGYSNPAYDRLYEQYATSLDLTKRQAAYADVMKLVAGDVASIPLYYTIAPMLVRKGVRGPGVVPMVQLGNAWNIHTWEMD
jgi:peptide/nickel transport system substrate-binding protein